MKGTVSRADLFRVFQEGCQNKDAAASALGFESRVALTLTPSTSDPVGPAEPPEFEINDQPLLEVPFLLPVRFESVEPLEQEGKSTKQRNTPRSKPVVWRGKPHKLPPHIPIGPEASAAMKIERMLQNYALQGRRDTDYAIQKITRGEIVKELPRKKMRIRPERLMLLVDVQPHLSPFQEDFRRVVRALVRQLPTTKISIKKVSEVDAGFLSGALADSIFPNGDAIPTVALTTFEGAGGIFWERLGLQLALGLRMLRSLRIC